MPIKLSEFRAKYPQYDDMDSDSLAQAIHRKYYADRIDYDTFAKEIDVFGDSHARFVARESGRPLTDQAAEFRQRERQVEALAPPPPAPVASIDAAPSAAAPLTPAAPAPTAPVPAAPAPTMPGPATVPPPWEKEGPAGDPTSGVQSQRPANDVLDALTAMKATGMTKGQVYAHYHNLGLNTTQIEPYVEQVWSGPTVAAAPTPPAPVQQQPQMAGMTPEQPGTDPAMEAWERDHSWWERNFAYPARTTWGQVRKMKEGIGLQNDIDAYTAATRNSNDLQTMDPEAGAFLASDVAPEATAQRIVDRIQKIYNIDAELQQVPRNPALTDAMVAGNKPVMKNEVVSTGEFGETRQDVEGINYAGFFENVGRDPLGVTWQLFMESAGISAPILLAGIAGGLVAGPAGAITGTGGASFAVEQSLTFIESIGEVMQAHGLDPKNMDNVKQAFAAPELLGEMKRIAAAKGLGVAAFDALSAGMASKVFMFTPESMNMAGRLAIGTVAEAPIQGALGASGEAAGQLLAYGDVKSPSDVGFEFLGELPGSLVDVPALGLAANREGLTKGQRLGRALDAEIAARGAPPGAAERAAVDLLDPNSYIQRSELEDFINDPRPAEEILAEKEAEEQASNAAVQQAIEDDAASEVLAAILSDLDRPETEAALTDQQLAEAAAKIGEIARSETLAPEIKAQAQEALDALAQIIAARSAAVQTPPTVETPPPGPTEVTGGPGVGGPVVPPPQTGGPGVVPTGPSVTPPPAAVPPASPGDEDVGSKVRAVYEDGEVIEGDVVETYLDDNDNTVYVINSDGYQIDFTPGIEGELQPVAAPPEAPPTDTGGPSVPGEPNIEEMESVERTDEQIAARREEEEAEAAYREVRLPQDVELTPEMERDYDIRKAEAEIRWLEAKIKADTLNGAIAFTKEMHEERLAKLRADLAELQAGETTQEPPTDTGGPSLPPQTGPTTPEAPQETTEEETKAEEPPAPEEPETPPESVSESQTFVEESTKDGVTTTKYFTKKVKKDGSEGRVKGKRYDNIQTAIEEFGFDLEKIEDGLDEFIKKGSPIRVTEMRRGEDGRGGLDFFIIEEGFYGHEFSVPLKPVEPGKPEEETISALIGDVKGSIKTKPDGTKVFSVPVSEEFTLEAPDSSVHQRLQGASLDYKPKWNRKENTYEWPEAAAFEVILALYDGQKGDPLADLNLNIGYEVDTGEEYTSTENAREAFNGLRREYDAAKKLRECVG